MSSRILLAVSTIWVVLYSNSRMSDLLPTSDLLRIFPLPREIRIFEIITILFLLIKTSSVIPSKTKYVQRLLVITALVAFFGVLRVGILNADAVQDVYVRIVPFVLYVAALRVGCDEKDMRSLLSFYWWVIIINVLVALVYQIPFHGDYEDYIHGFFSDAHMFGTFVAIASIVLLREALATKRWRLAILSASLFAFSLYPSNGKVVLMNAVLALGMLIAQVLHHSTWGRRTVISVVLIGAFFLGADRLEQYLLDRANLRLEFVVALGIDKLGPIVAWPLAVTASMESIETAVVGLGAGQYGWLAAGRMLSKGSASQAALEFEGEFSEGSPTNAGFSFRTNTWSSLLAEYGIVGFLCFVLALYRIIALVVGARERSALDRRLRTAFLAGMGLTIYQGFFTPFSNWSESVMMFPLMMIAAYFSSRNDSPALVHGKSK